VTKETSYRFDAEDFKGKRRPVEQPGRSARHAGHVFLAQHPEIYKLLNPAGHTVCRRQGDMIQDVSRNGTVRDAMEKAQAVAAPVAPEPLPPPASAAASGSIMQQIREVLEPLYPQLPMEFGRLEVENLLRAYGHAHLITKSSISNVLNSFAAQDPPRRVRAVTSAAGVRVNGRFEVLEEVRNAGRKAAKKAARKEAKGASAAAPPPAPTQHALLTAPDPIGFDPKVVPAGGRNAAYAERMLRATNGSNGTHPAPAPEPPPPTPAPAPEPPPPPPPQIPPQQLRSDLLTLLTSGLVEANEADLKEWQEAEEMFLESVERMGRVMKRVTGFMSFRRKMGEMLASV
jgi:hypothetical protein